MKIFVLVSRVPYPLEKGDKLRAYHQIRTLARDHEVFLCCLSDRPVDPESIRHLQSIVHHVEVIYLNRVLILWRLLRAVFSDRPFQVHYFYQSHAARKIRLSIDGYKPDHIFCQLIRCSEYVKQLHTYRKTLDYMDALSAGLHRRIPYSSWFQRLFIREEARRLVAYENLIFEYFDHLIIISDQDRQLIHHPERQRIHVIANGVDTTYFAPEEITDAKAKNDIVFTGNMSYPPNVDCALRLALAVLPEIRRTLPNTRLLIAGANPTPAVLALKSELTEVTGWMEDIRPAYRESKLFMAPMRIGSGTQNKLLEALSHQLPCITSSLAGNALPKSFREVISIADSNTDLAAIAVALLQDEKRRTELGRRGRQLIREQFDWDGSVRQLEQLFQSTHVVQ